MTTDIGNIFEDIMASVHELDVDAEYTKTEQKEQFEVLNKNLGIKEIGCQICVPVRNSFTKAVSSSTGVPNYA